MVNESGIKYCFGLDGDGQLVDIGESRVLRGQDYTCLSCSRALRPVLGEIRQRHFRHRHDSDCSLETYLHNLGKLTFYNAFRTCLDTGKPYWFEFPVYRQCTYCEYGPCPVPEAVERTDLTRIFPVIYLEQRDGELIPDILLQGEGSHKLYVEIVVTHYAEEKKQKSGVRMLEIKVESEDDVEMLQSKVLSLYSERVHGYNLRTSPVAGDFKEMCTRNGTFFHLDMHGAATPAVITVSALPDLRAKGGYIEKIPKLKVAGSNPVSRSS